MKDKILVVDNNPLIVKLLSSFLEKEGYEVQTADSGVAALRLLETFIPDVMITDLIMPRISGDKLCQIVRNKPETRDIYIIILTGIAAEEKIDCRSYGADACIAKGPVKKVRDHLKALLQQRDVQGRETETQGIVGLDGITERSMTKELIKSKKELEIILGNISEGIIQLTHDRIIIYANSAALFLLGISEEKLLGVSVTDVFTGHSSKVIGDMLESIGHDSQQTDACFFTLKNRYLSLRLHQIDEEEKTFIITMRDISERKKSEDELLAYQENLENLVRERTDALSLNNKRLLNEIKERTQAEKAMQESHNMLHMVLNAIPSRVFWKDLDSVYLGCNQVFAHDAGCSSAEQVIGKNDFDLVWADQAESQKAADKLVLASGEARLNFEEPRTTSDGKQIWFETSKIPLANIDGKVIGILGVYNDITERKEAKRKLEQEEEHYRVLVESITNGVQESDIDGTVTFSNTAYHTMLGYAPGELIGKKMWDRLDSEGSQNELRDYYAFILENEPHPTPYLTKNRTKDGRIIDVQIDWNYKRDMKGNVIGFISVITDITERIQFEKSLSESEERYRDLFENANDIIQILNKDGHFLFVNRSWREVFGYSQEEITDMTVFDLIHQDCSEICENTFNRIIAEGRLNNFQTSFVTKNGRKVLLAGSASCKFEEGEVQSIRCMFRDITEQKNLEAQFLQAQKMEAIGRLAGGVAHDFNNMLTTIIGYSDLVLMQLQDGHPFKEQLKAINKAGKSSADLTRQLLAFSRKQLLEIKAINLNKIIDDLSKMLQRMLGEDVELRSNLRAVKSDIMADPVQLEQILMNLAVNSRDAMPNGGELIIETAECYLDENYVKTHKGMKPGEYVQLSVRDTGEGMAQEVQEKIFEPFFTTKEEGKGTGLGLATIYGIVKQHASYIYVESEINKGTCFKIFFPVAAMKSEQSGIQSQEAALPGGNETVLVVDDNQSVREVICETLRPLGYRILEAKSGEDALTLAKNVEDPIQLLLTDVIMPKMNGLELAEKLQGTRPEMKQIFMSGYSGDVLLDRGNLKPGLHLLNKPLSPNRLATMIRDVLREKKGGSGAVRTLNSADA